MAGAGVSSRIKSVYQPSAEVFRAAVVRAKRQNRNGWMVDAHSVSDYRRNYRLFMDSEGTAGVAVHKRTGNIVSVFSSQGGGNAMGYLIPTAIEAGGRRLDAFADGLHTMYGRHGGTLTGRVKFDPSQAPEGWRQGMAEPDVVMMTMPTSLEEWERQYKRDRQTDLFSAKLYDDWGDMDAATEKALDERASREGGRASMQAALGGGR